MSLLVSNNKSSTKSSVNNLPFNKSSHNLTTRLALQSLLPGYSHSTERKAFNAKVLINFWMSEEINSYVHDHHLSKKAFNSSNPDLQGDISRMAYKIEEGIIFCMESIKSDGNSFDIIDLDTQQEFMRLGIKTYADNTWKIDHDILSKMITACMKQQIQHNSPEELNSLQEKFSNACERGDAQLVKKMIKRGIDIDFIDPLGETPLMIASAHGKLSVVELLLRHHAKINVQSHSGETALIRAILNNHPVVARKLIAKGANVNLGNKEHDTPLHIACLEGNLKCFELLLTAGANIHKKNREKASILNCAAAGGNAEIVRRLVEAGLKIDYSTDVYGSSLLIACMGFQETCIEKLLDLGATTHVHNVEGITPISTLVGKMDASHPTFERMIARDQGYSEEIQQTKKLCNRFALPITLGHMEGGPPYLGTSWNEFHGAKSLMEDMRYYTRQMDDNRGLKALLLELEKYPDTLKIFKKKNDKIFESLHRTLKDIEGSLDHKKLTAEEILEKIDREGIVTFMESWEDHTVGFALIKEEGSLLFMRCDRSGSAGNAPGVRIQKVTKPEQVKAFLEKAKKKFTQDLFTDEADQMLGLKKEMIYLKQTSQIHAGNCPIASANALALGTLYYELVSELGHLHAKRLAKILKRQMSKVTREREFDHYLSKHASKKTERWPVSFELIDALALKKSSDPALDRNRKERIERWKIGRDLTEKEAA